MIPFRHSTRKKKWQIWIFALPYFLLSVTGIASPADRQTSTDYRSLPQSFLTTNHLSLVSESSIFFKPSAHMDVTSLIASITPEKNLVPLTDSGAQNDSMVMVHMGTVASPSGKNFSLDFFGDDLVTFAVDEKTLNGDISQTDTGIADVDKILVSTKTVQKVMNQAVFMGNMKEADSVTLENGEIILVADESRAAGADATPHTEQMRIASQDTVTHPDISIPNTRVSIIEALPENTSRAALTKASEVTHEMTPLVSPRTDIVTTIHSPPVTQPNTVTVNNNILANEKTTKWSNILLVSMIFLGACIATGIWTKRRRLRIAQHTAKFTTSAAMISMRQQVTEISQFAGLIARESPGEISGPWKNYIDRIVAKSTDIESVIERIQQKGAHAESASSSVAELRSALRDIMASAELMKQDPHMYSKHVKKYTETILSDARKALEKSDDF